MNSFAFIDSSGIIKQDRFFGVGLLIVENIGESNLELSKIRQRAYLAFKKNKDTKINELIEQKKYDEVVKILENNKRFEMKYDNIRLTLVEYYKEMIDVFFSNPLNKFSVIIVDKENPKFHPQLIKDTWEAYAGFSASLIIKNLQITPDDRMCIVLDEISKPNNKPNCLEQSVIKKIKLKVARYKNISMKNIFGVISIESHSNLLMQLSDILLGAVMYDHKKNFNLVGNKVISKKEDFVSYIRTALGKDSLVEKFSITKPVGFRIIEPHWT